MRASAPRKSSREEIVDLERIRRPSAERAAAGRSSPAHSPGVGLGSHSDPSKSAQHTAQINGGNGRNINTLVDGGDNNDDTVGGLLQLFPLEAIEEFNLLSQRFDAEYGRGSAVMNIVTKSGTNALRGSGFTLMRDDALNAADLQREASPDSPSRHTGDISTAAASADRSSGTRRTSSPRTSARSRTRKQVVDTDDLLPGDGIYDVPFREDLFTAKLTATLDPAQYLAVRYASRSQHAAERRRRQHRRIRRGRRARTLTIR